MPVFGGLNDETLELILQNSTNKTVLQGEYFFREGDPANELFVIQLGAVVVEKNWAGKVFELDQFGIGDCVGEMAIVDLQPRSAAVRALTHCEAIEITRATLLQIYQKSVEQYAISMMNMGREISRRLRAADQRLFEIDIVSGNDKETNLDETRRSGVTH